jgi:hypothetical protein
MKKLILVLILGIGLIGIASADTQSLTMRFTIPSSEPKFDNLRNFIHDINTEFSQSITASVEDISINIECYWLNDTTKFDVDCNGLITNTTPLLTIEKIYLKITANSTLGDEVDGDFFIDIRERVIAIICRYKNFGIVNERIPFMKERDCIIEQNKEGFGI